MKAQKFIAIMELSRQSLIVVALILHENCLSELFIYNTIYCVMQCGFLSFDIHRKIEFLGVDLNVIEKNWNGR